MGVDHPCQEEHMPCGAPSASLRIRPITSFARHVGRRWHWRALCMVSLMSLTIGFCGGCGQALTAIPLVEPTYPFSTPRLEEQPASPATSMPVTPHPADAERRQLTVMFCDLTDSTPLSEQLDLGDLREVVRAYQQASTEVIQRFDGHIAQLLGDGLLVYFGFPQAHDDDAQRAVQAGLGILATMETLNRQLKRNEGLRLAVPVGIHTGLVVVGEMGGGYPAQVIRRGQEALPLAHPASLAAARHWAAWLHLYRREAAVVQA